MKAASVRELKIALQQQPSARLVELCLQLAKFKKDNKEYLTYLVYEADDEAAYIRSVKSEVEAQFEEMNRKSYYFIKKSVRKILRQVKKYIRYSKKKETEVELLLHFCWQLRELQPPISRHQLLQNIYERQLALIRKKIGLLHEDLQYDYAQELQALRE